MKLKRKSISCKILSANTQREAELPREQGETGGCGLLSLGMEEFSALSSLSKEGPAANYPVSPPEPSPTHRCCISNTNFEHGSKALSPSKFPSPSWLSSFGTTGDYFCSPVSWFYTFQTLPSASNLSLSFISKSVFNSLQWSYSKGLWNASLRHISSPDSAACKYYNFVLCGLYFQVSNGNYGQADTNILWPVQCRWPGML